MAAIGGVALVVGAVLGLMEFGRGSELGFVLVAGILLAVGLALMFTLAPATRWGYFVYPIGLVAWLVLTQPPAQRARRPEDEAQPDEIPAQAAVEQPVTATVR